MKLILFIHGSYVLESHERLIHECRTIVTRANTGLSPCEYLLTKLASAD